MKVEEPGDWVEAARGIDRTVKEVEGGWGEGEGGGVLPFGMQFFQDRERLHGYAGHHFLGQLLLLRVPDVPQAGPQHVQHLYTTFPSRSPS